MTQTGEPRHAREAPYLWNDLVTLRTHPAQQRVRFNAKLLS